MMQMNMTGKPPIYSRQYINKKKIMTDTCPLKRLIGVKWKKKRIMFFIDKNRNRSNGSINMIKMKLETAGKLSCNTNEWIHKKKRMKYQKHFNYDCLKLKRALDLQQQQKKNLVPFFAFIYDSDVIGSCMCWALPLFLSSTSSSLFVASKRMWLCNWIYRAF